MYQVYQILDNESLESLADKFNTTVSDLKSINGIVNDDVTVGSLIVKSLLVTPKVKLKYYATSFYLLHVYYLK